MKYVDNGIPHASTATYFRRFLFGMILAAIYLLGSYASLKTNVTWDTEQEQRDLVINVKAVKGLLKGDLTDYQTLLAYSDKYYGMGFDAPASVIQTLAYKSVAKYFGTDNATAYLTTKQWITFTLFFVSAVLFFLLSRLVTEDELFSMLATLGYLLWPYILGQSFLNVKDIPFLFGWFLGLYLSSLMAEKYCRTQRITRTSVCILAIITGWSMSIRMPGGLALIQYCFVFISAWRFVPQHAPNEIRMFGKHLLLFLLVTTIAVFLSSPVFWLGPQRIFDAIEYMRHHPLALLGHCTLTLGECMFAAALPATYLPAWLSIKLPLIVIAGYLALPFSFRKYSKNISSACILKPAIYTSITITVLLWATGAMLYNEIRHILFLMPLFFFAGIHSLYFLSKKLATALLIITIGLFSLDNVLAYPYQYIWFNEIARQFQVENYFETDYWGSSGRSLAKKFLASSADKPFNCAYIDGDLTGRLFLHWESIGCVHDEFPGPETQRPYFIVGYTRTGVRQYPENCTELEREHLKLLGGKDIVLGRIVYCR